MSRLAGLRTMPNAGGGRSRKWLITVGPASLVVLPLLGTSLKSDERLHLYQQVHLTDVNLFGISRYVEERIFSFLNIGNFRPVGRFTEVLIHGVVFEGAETTGLAPHVLLGIVRVIVVALFAVLAVKMVTALARSARVDADKSLVSLYPLAVGAVLVANGIIGGLAQFPHTFIGSIVLIQAAALTTARDEDLQPRTIRFREYAAMTLWGAVLVLFYDLVYLAPLVSGAFLVARVTAARLTLRITLTTAAVRRWAAFTAGFAVVFVPARIDIARRCAQNDCYSASDLSISNEVFETALPRLATGLPPVGWAYNADLAERFSIDAGLWDLASNSVLAAMLASIAVLAVVLTARGWRTSAARTVETVSRAPMASSITPEPAPAVAVQGPAHGRLAITLASLGIFMAILAASLAGLSASMQQRNLTAGAAWREAQLAQLAWSLVIAGTLASIDLVTRSDRARRAARALVAAVLAVGVAFTLLANWRFAEADRRDPSATVTSLIAASTIHVDDSETGNAIRCLLIDGYTHTTPETVWIAGWRLREDLDRFMTKRHGLLYCDPSQAESD